MLFFQDFFFCIVRESVSSLSHSYLHYQQRPIPITDVLSLTLAFVRDETAWGEDGERPVATELAEKRPRTSLFPTPRYKSEQELDVLQQCLGRWKEELTQDIEGQSLARNQLGGGACPSREPWNAYSWPRNYFRCIAGASSSI